MESETLETCPFCGGGVSPSYHSQPAVLYSFSCTECGSTGPQKEDWADAARSWNRRALRPVRVTDEAVEVERVECVTFDNGYEEPTDPLWRINLDGYCADFETNTAAQNFADAINRRAALSAGTVPSVVDCEKAPNRKHIWMTPTDKHYQLCAWCGLSRSALTGGEQ